MNIFVLGWKRFAWGMVLGIGGLTQAMADPITPTLDGVQQQADGSWLAFFGAQNTQPATVTVPTGSDNKLVPATPSVTLPTSFESGRKYALISVPFSGAGVTWTLGGTSVTATTTSPVYAPLGDRLAAVVRHRPQINGKLDGSGQQFLAEQLILNSGAVVTGDLLVPGTPTVVKNGTPVFYGAVVGSGSASPSGWQIVLNQGSSVRYLATRTDAGTMPVAEAPLAPIGSRSVNLNNASDPVGDWATLRNLNCNGNTGSLAVPPGAYGTFGAGGSWELKLGVAGATTPALYSFQSWNLNSTATFKIVGPVEIRLGGSFNNNGILGDPSHPDWLVLKLASGGVNLNSNSKIYGKVIAPAGSVQINSGALLVGQVASNDLTINAGGELRFGSTTAVANQPPIGHIDNISVAQNAPPYLIDLRTKFTDANDAVNSLSFAVQSNSNPGLVATAVDPSTGVLTLNFGSGGSGEANLVVRATDPLGLTGDAPFKVTVVHANLPPSVSLVVPGEGTVVSPGTPVTIAASASDDEGVASVQFFAGTTLVGTTTAQPYSITWTPTAIGTYSIVAAARDTAGALTTSAPVHIIVNAPPTISITAPGAGDSLMVGSPVNVTLNVADAEGQLAGVELFVDGNKVAQNTTAPYGLTWTGPTIGHHTLTAKATDSYGAVTTSEPVAIFINQRPTVAITAPVSGAVLQGPLDITVTASATDPDGTVANLQVLSNGAPIGSATNGVLSFVWTGVAPGSYTLTAVATDDRGATTTSLPTSITVLPTVPPVNELVEGSRFQTLAAKPVTIPPGAGTLTFTISDLTFDTTSVGRIRDAFELALVDATGQTLVPVTATGREAFFNMTDGQDSQIAGGVVVNDGAGTTRTISVNVSGVPAGTPGQLVARLINDDGDTTTSVHLGDVTFSAAPVEGTEPAEAPDLSSAGPLNWSQFAALSGGLSVQYGVTAWNDSAKVLFADAALRNDLSTSANQHYVLVIDQISDASVRVVNGDGLTPQNVPYFDYTKAIPNPLAAGASSLFRTIAFSNPNRVVFTYRATIYCQVHRAPVWTSTPLTTAVSGRSYIYAGAATDPDGDNVSYSVIAGPSGLTISDAGQVAWNVPAGTVGAQLVTLRASDGNGGQTDQTYTLLVGGPVPNRPPVFTSTPIVDVAAGSGYSYTAAVQDADADAVVFSLVSGPAGLTVAASGQVSWLPTIAQLGVQNVVIKADDQHGGVTNQSYAIAVHQVLGNHAPIFLSSAQTQFSVPSTGTNTWHYLYQPEAIDPDGDAIKLDFVSGPAGTLISPTGSLDWVPSAVGSYAFTVSADDGRGGRTTQSFTVTVDSASLAAVRGFVFNDHNGNGLWDGTRPATSSGNSNVHFASAYSNTDFVSAGYGGMRDYGSGVIALSGVSGRVNTALLYWAGPGNSTDPTINATVSFAGQTVTGKPLGLTADNGWGYANSSAYVADVTPLVGGNGAYALSNFIKRDGAGNVVANIDGASLLVFYDDGNRDNDRDILLFHGNDSNASNPYEADNWNFTAQNISYTSGPVQMEMHVADGQTFLFHDNDDGPLTVNGTVLATNYVFSGTSTPTGPFNAFFNPGSLWDVRSFDISALLTPGNNNLNVQSPYRYDAVSLIAVVFKLPPGSAPEAGMGAGRFTPISMIAGLSTRVSRPRPRRPMAATCWPISLRARRSFASPTRMAGTRPPVPMALPSPSSAVRK